MAVKLASHVPAYSAEPPSLAGLAGVRRREGIETAFDVERDGLVEVLRSLRDDGSTVHGFRSSFRDWAAEQTDFPREVVEACLAHALGDGAELAYKRTDFLERRREVMEAWQAYCLA